MASSFMCTPYRDSGVAVGRGEGDSANGAIHSPLGEPDVKVSPHPALRYAIGH